MLILEMLELPYQRSGDHESDFSQKIEDLEIEVNPDLERHE
jgi:hypothetical protein